MECSILKDCGDAEDAYCLNAIECYEIPFSALESFQQDEILSKLPTFFSHLNNFKNSFKKYGYRCLLSDKSFSALLVILTGPSYHLLPLKFFWKFYRENSMVLKNMIAQLHIYLIAFNCCHALCKNLIQSSKHYLILGLHLTFKNLMSSKHQKFMVETET